MTSNRTRKPRLVVHSAPWALPRPDGYCTILCGLDPTDTTKSILRNGHTPDQDLDDLYGSGPGDKSHNMLGCPDCVAVWERLGLVAHPSWKRKERRRNGQD